MTKALEKAFREASKLPEQKQDALASAILAELEADRTWEGALEKSQSALESLADDALSEHRSGKTRPLDPDKL